MTVEKWLIASIGAFSGLVCILVAIVGFRTGEVPSRYGNICRDGNPILFHLYLIGFTLLPLFIWGAVLRHLGWL